MPTDGEAVSSRQTEQLRHFVYHFLIDWQLRLLDIANVLINREFIRSINFKT